MRASEALRQPLCCPEEDFEGTSPRSPSSHSGGRAFLLCAVPLATLAAVPDEESGSHVSTVCGVSPCFYKLRHGRCLGTLSDGDPVLPSPSGDQEAWQKGVLFASGQNLARQLMETPANEMTPTRFAEIIEKNLKSASSKTEVHIR